MEKLTNSVLSGRLLSTFIYYVSSSMVALVAITTAHLVDGFFVGNYVGGESLAAITLLIPYFTGLTALALMLAIGGSVSAGKFIGEGNQAAASAIFSQTLIAIVVITGALAVISYCFEPYLFQLLNIPPVLEHQARDYFNVIRWVLIIQLFTMVLYYYVRADGFPMLAMSALMAGALCNILLDAWFIAHLNLGMSGAAYATAISQIIQCVILGYYFCKPSKTLSFFWRQTQWRRLFQAIFNGVSEFINEISVGLIFLLLNTLLVSRLGVNGVAAFSVANYFMFLGLMLAYGIADALHLLVSQNHGAKQYLRSHQFLWIALGGCLLMGTLIASVLLLWDATAIGWFLDSNSQIIAQTAAQLILILWPVFLIHGANINLSCYLTAIHQPKASALIAVLRSLLLPAIFLYSFYTFGLDFFPFNRLPVDESLIFLIALPIAEWITFVVAIVLYLHFKRLEPVDSVFRWQHATGNAGV